MRLAIDNQSENLFTGAVKVHKKTLVEVGINRDDRSAWPIAVSLVQQNRHFYLTRTAARRLAELLQNAADGVEVQCRVCAEVEDAPVHDPASGKWRHVYDEQAV